MTRYHYFKTSALILLYLLKQSISMPNYTRPGVEAAVRLSKRVGNNQHLWTAIEAKYEDMLQVKNRQAKKKKGNVELLGLDRDCEQLGDKWRGMISYEGDDDKDFHAFMTCEELYTVMKWKFTKGKSRPLWKYIHSNSSEDVEKYSSMAFSKVMKKHGQDEDDENNDNSHIYEAIEDLSNLKGLGPAGSSAILSLIQPNLFVFMDDEVIEALYEDERKYSLKIYKIINDKCLSIASQLGDGWTPRRVGKALWSAAIVSGYSDEVDLTIMSEKSNGSVTADKDDDDDDNDEKRQRKKRRKK